MTDGNVPCLFRYDDRDGVRFFRDSKCRTMPEAQSAVEVFALADRKDAGRRDDPIVPNNHATIVERCLREKNRDQKLLRHLAVNIDTALSEGSDRGISFYGQQCADLPAGKFEDCIGDDVDRFLFLGRRREKLAAAKLCQSSAQLRLKYNDQGDRQERRQASQAAS